VKTLKNRLGHPRNWSFNKWSALYYQGESDLLNTWVFNKFVNNSVPARALCHLVPCHGPFACIDDALSPIFVEKIPLDSPLMFGNTFVCIDDEPRWKVAVACGRQFCGAALEDAGAGADYEQFLAQSGLPLRSALLPIASASPEGRPSMFAKQMFHSRLIKDLYDDIETVAELYVRLLLLASDPYSVAKNWPGMPEAEFAEFQERLKNNNRLLFDQKVFEYVLNYFFDSKAFGPKTRYLWRQHKFLFETLVGQACYEIGHSLLCCDDRAERLYFDRIGGVTPRRILDFLEGAETPALPGNNFENAEAERQAWAAAEARARKRREAEDASVAAPAKADVDARAASSKKAKPVPSLVRGRGRIGRRGGGKPSRGPPS
jgi:hypothetical protein